MKKKTIKLNNKQQAEIDFFSNWLFELCDFFDEHNLLDTQMLRQDIKKGKSMGWLSGAKQAYNDMNSGLHDLPKDKFSELNRRLKERFGKDLYDADKKLSQKARRIAKRGKISTEEEYYLVRAYLDSIEDIPEHENEYNQLRNMYFEFEMQESEN